MLSGQPTSPSDNQEDTGMTAILGPHQGIASSDPRETFTADLLDRLWDSYRNRVSYVQTYEQVVRNAGATFVNDHIAFRTFASQQPLTGIVSLSRIFEALGYRPAGTYLFEDKHLNATHYQHSNSQFPKIFISELKVWELGEEAQIIWKYTANQRPAIDEQILRELNAWHQVTDLRRTQLMKAVLQQFQELPWPLPEKQDVEQLNRVSQYAAWVLVHGYHVNHFTSLVNSHGIESLENLEKTIAALQKAGVPMKAEIEGEPGSKLRQSATEAVRIDVEVQVDGQRQKMPWSYAYFELAERNLVTDPDTGKKVRFEGFLGAQATNLFEMTRVK
jgi:hypothetical protein